MLVYRVESSTEQDSGCSKVGVGAYRVNAIACYLNKITESDRHPTPYEDSPLSEWWEDEALQELWYFGFKDVAQFKSWFYEDSGLESLTEDMRIGVYECEEVKVGYTQVCFVAMSSRLVGTLPITTKTQEEADAILKGIGYGG